MPRAPICLYPTILSLCQLALIPTSYPQRSTALGRIKIDIWVVTIITDLKIWAYWFPGQGEAHEGLGYMDNTSGSQSLLQEPLSNITHGQLVWRVYRGETTALTGQCLCYNGFESSPGSVGALRELWQHRTSHPPDTSLWMWAFWPWMTMPLWADMVSFNFEGPYPFKHQTSREETEKENSGLGSWWTRDDWLSIYWVWM